MNHMINRFLLGALIVVATNDAHAAAVAPFSTALPQLCKTLQQQGWMAPEDLLNPGRRQTAEINVPGVMYLCTLEHRLSGQGPGHRPDLQVLLSDSGNDPSIIFSADIWCERDRAAALTALADQLAKEMPALGWSVPKETLAAVRAGAARTQRSSAIVFSAKPIAVDSRACEHVGDDALGPVWMKLDVTVEPVAHGK
ncbi:MAG: hypothetical protein ABIR62_06615 [Dokdonella sp.]|uniref:hypothetical protein n=1 Tax=Dokdonella sp. TaxID=2291710 RepID=UPI003264FCAA